MSRVLCLLTALLLVVSGVNADQYWITYEGNDFPENEGWTRNYSGGGAERSIENGALMLDSTDSTDIHDDYQHCDVRTPAVGEMFVAEWRVRLNAHFDYNLSQNLLEE